ncbi:MAG: transketolase, partial [Pseudomonadota bacterium]
ALIGQGGPAWRERLLADIGEKPNVRKLLADFDDGALADLMTNLGGHCVATLSDAFDACDDDRPTLFIAYTVKGFGLPLAGHKDNHSGMMNPTQMDGYRKSLGIAEGAEWEPYGGLGDNAAAQLKAFVEDSAMARQRREAEADSVPVPARFAVPAGKDQSTQAAFGKILLDLAKSGEKIGDRIVTTAPDVTQTTNLGAFVNQRGLFRRQEVADVFQQARIPSAQKWLAHGAGQHIELGIAENNFFLMLTSMGLTAPHFGTRLLPVGTVYDPFIARGLDALNYGCYQDSRFLLVGTPSGLTLGPEGGAHQSINTPLIGMGQPGLVYFEPVWADEVALMMRWAFDHMQQKDGSSVYLRLSTRAINQIYRADDDWEADALKGGYWLKRPASGSEAAIVFSGAIAPEVLEAYDNLVDDIPGLGVLNVTSPDLLHRGWSGQCAGRWTGADNAPCHAGKLLGELSPDAGLITVLDGSPSALSWLGSIHGMRVSPLGTDRFGQTGDLPDLYETYRIDHNAIIDAAAELFLD